MENFDGLIWFGGITLFFLTYFACDLTARALRARKARRMARNAARRRSMERHPASQGWQPSRPDAADYALRQWTEQGR